MTFIFTLININILYAMTFQKQMRFILIVLYLLIGSDVKAAPIPENSESVPVYNLEQCIELGLKNNIEILKAQREIERSQGVVITAKSLLYPKVNLAGRLETRNDDALSQGNDAKLQRFRDYWTVSLIATQSLYSGGANRQQIAIAKLKNDSALVQLRAISNQVLRNIRYAVYEIIVNQAQIEAQQKTILLLTQEFSRQQQYFDAGKTTRFNVLRTQVGLSNQKAQLLQAQTQLISSQIALSQLLNIAWLPQERRNPPFIIKDELSCPPFSDTLPELISLALNRRPELEVLTKQIEISERQLKIDKATNIPRIDAFAGYEVRRDQSESSFDSNVNSGTVGLLGSWNIFDGFTGRGQAMSTTAQINSARLSLGSTRLQIQNDVRDAYERLKTAEQSVQIQGTNIQTAEDSVRLSRNSADAGYATLLDVLQATLDLNTARLEAIRARQRYMKALADLQFAISLKFQDQEVALSPPPLVEKNVMPTSTP
jgi:outer membrane protein TolC